MAAGQAQCAVTGDAFHQLLQGSDLSILEAVMRNVVVFARMKPNQKGQVMDLLSVRGLHQMHQGRPRHIQVKGAWTSASVCLSVCASEAKSLQLVIVVPVT